MNSLYTDKRYFFNLKLNLLSSHNKEIRKQRIQVENETPKISLPPKVSLQRQVQVEVEVVEVEVEVDEFDLFVKKFKKQNKKYRKNKRNNWDSDTNLRIAYQHYNITVPETKSSSKVVIFG